MYKAIVYLNQFFGQIGGEEMAGYEPAIKEGLIGPALAMKPKLKDTEITHTIICGDNYMTDHPEEALDTIGNLLADKKFDILLAGPAFMAGRYGDACCRVCKYVTEHFGIPAVTSMNEANPGVEMYRNDVYITKGHDNAGGMRKDVPVLCALANKLLSGDKLLGADAENYFSRGIRQEIEVDKNVEDRAMDMLFKKLNGAPFESELRIEQPDEVPILDPIDVSRSTVAFISTGGLVPMGNPDRIPSASATKWARYDMSSEVSLKEGEWETVHGGYDSRVANKNPNAIVPWDALLQHEKEGHIGALNKYYYATTGNHTSKKDSVRMAGEIFRQLTSDGVNAVIFGST